MRKRFRLDPTSATGRRTFLSAGVLATGGAIGGRLLPEAPVPWRREGETRLNFGSRRVSEVSVASFGARGDGRVDEYEAFERGLREASRRGLRLFIPPGTFRVSRPLTISAQGIQVSGSGAAATRLVVDSSGLLAAASDVRVSDMAFTGVHGRKQLFSSGYGAQARRNWLFENVSFEGVGVTVGRHGALTNEGETYGGGANFEAYVEFSRCLFAGYLGDGALSIRGTHHVLVDKCRFRDSGTDITEGDQFKVCYGAEFWRVTNSTFERSSRDAIDCFDANRGLIHACTIIRPGAHGIEMKFSGANAPNPADRNRVSGTCVVSAGHSTTAPGMQLATHHVIAESNMIEGGSGIGIRAGHSMDGTQNAQNITWHGNQVIGAAGHGFALNGVDGAVIASNQAVSCGGAGYYMPGDVNSAVIGGPSGNLDRANASMSIWP